MIVWLWLGCQNNSPKTSDTHIPQSSTLSMEVSNLAPTENMIPLEGEDGSFWIDIYEYPNVKGTVPLSSTTFMQAQELCQAQKKRLCTASEWRRACSGPSENQRFGYGKQYEEGRCHLQKALKSGHSSMMKPEEQLAKSGERERCSTPEGVHDLIGNLEEWVFDDWKGIAGGLEGGAWYTYSQYADCSGRYSRQPDYRISIDRRIFSAGFRCCFSTEDLDQEKKSRDAQNRIQKAKQNQTHVTYDPSNEVSLSANTFIDRFEYPNQPGVHPLSAVTAQEAETLCVQNQKRLCEAFEWEIACGDHIYPYGTQFISSACAVGLQNLAPSGYFLGCQSPSGAIDMVGNLWEWTATKLEAPALINNNELREIRGGSWFVDHRKSTCQAIDGYPATTPSQAFPDVGFRCCRGPVLQRVSKKKTLISCPPNMVSGTDFCIDTYEYPNQKNIMPQGGISYTEAKRICLQQKKRLCREKEWEEACMGWEGFRWPYGDTYRASVCVDAGGSTREGESGSQPAGDAVECVSTIGAYDMSGNLWEWVEEQTLKGGGWNLSAGLGQCKAQAKATQNFQAGEVGFRCCADPLP